MTTTPQFQPPADPRYLDTFATVRGCTNFVRRALREYWHDHLGVPWGDSERLMDSQQVGSLAGDPVCVMVSWATLGGSRGKRVAFVEDTSLIVDHSLIDVWMRGVFPNCVVSTDPTNFHHVVSSISDALNVRTILRYEMQSMNDTIVHAVKGARMDANFFIAKDPK